jgi:hypothetical protein
VKSGGAVNDTDLAGKRVVITVAEPPEFVRECGKAKFTGSIVELDTNHCLVELEEPLKVGDREFLTALCQTRHEGTSTSELASGGGVALNVTLMSKRERSLAEVKRSDFRGGYAVVVVMVLVE